MIVVDTNVLINLLLDGPASTGARALYARDTDWRSEPLINVELTNALATMMRVRRYPLPDALRTLAEGQRIVAPALHRASDSDALTTAAHFGVSGYDARFLVVARGLGSKLVTEDAKLRSAAPALTCSIAEALAT